MSSAVDFDREKKEAEEALAFAEESFGRDHPMVAARLESLAALLRKGNKQLLEAANMEARAKVIRAKFDNEEFLTGRRPQSTDTTGGAEHQTADNALSQYKIISKIGAGGMGTVYKASHEKIDKPLAVKILSATIAESIPARKRFEQEIQAACNLTHPNLVSVYDFGITDKGSPYLVMDYIAGVTLAEEIKCIGNIGSARALNIFVQLAEGIEHAHSKGILHRDIKPSNIMLYDDSNQRDFVKVVDFGIAKLMPSQGKEGKTVTNTSDVIGSPYYMSPEQCMGEELDQRSDIYAIGCVMYETLTGKPPFSQGNTIKVIFQHLNADREGLLRRLRKFKLQPGMEQVVLRCLQKKAADRYQSLAELQKDLRSLQSGKQPRVFLPPGKTQLAVSVGSAMALLGLGLTLLPAISHKPLGPAPAVEVIQDTVGPKIAAAREVSPGTALTPASTPLPATEVPVPKENPPPPKKYASKITALPIDSPTDTKKDYSNRPNEGAIDIGGNTTYTLSAGTHRISRLHISGNGHVLLGGQVTLVIDDASSSPITIEGNGSINPGGNPSRLEILYHGNGAISLSGNGTIYGSIKAPFALVAMQGNGKIVSSNSFFSNQPQAAQQLMANSQASQMAQLSQRQQALYESAMQARRDAYRPPINLRKEIQEKITQHWFSPAANSNCNHMVMVQFRLDSLGAANDIRVLVSSGSTEVDDCAISAIRFSSPFSSPDGETMFQAQFANGRVTVF